MSDDSELQRSVGRIEGQNLQILEKLNELIKAQIKHEDQDRLEFRSVRKAQEDNRIVLEHKIADLITDQQGDDEGQDKRIAKLELEQARAKSAGWAILALLGSLASLVGGAVISVLSGHVGIRWH